jgi:predicted HAD superfamily Cof-like phosphohydrolase
MTEQIKKLEEFQKAFNHPFAEKPTCQTPKVGTLRYKLLKEENEEYLEAMQQQDIVGIADALGDALYIVLGSIVAHGLQDVILPVFNEIHNSNMSKLDENGKPIINDGILAPDLPIGKILKSPNYVKPDLKQFFNGKEFSE